MNREFFRKYLDILNEGPPPGVGPNATRQAPQQQLGQPDTFTKMLPGMGNKAIDAGKGLVNPYAKTMSNFTPGSEYYEKNVKNNPQVKAQVDTFMKTAPTAKDLGASVDATKQAFDQALTQKQTVGGTSAEYDKAAGQLGMPAVQQPTQPQQTQPTTEEELDENGRMRKLLDMLDEAPATAINPNDPNAAAFGKKINTTAGTAQPTTNKTPGLTAATTGGGYSTPQNNTTNIDTRATVARDRLQQQMASGKINTPAPQTVNPNQKYGGGYDPTKVQYASGNNPTAPTASASQSAALDASKTKAIGGTPQTASAAQSQANQTSKANVIGGGMQQMTQNNQNPSMDPYNPATDPSLQAGYAAVAKPDVEGLKLGVAAGTPSAAQTNQQTQTASTGGGFQGGGYGSVGNQGQTAQVEEEELEEELQKILRLSGKQRQPTNENDSLKKFYNILNEATDNDEIELHDSFDIELNEHFVIETGIIGFTEDGIIIEADETLLGLLEVNNILCEEETTHSKPDTNKKDKPSDYMDTKPATDKRMDTSKLMDKEPLKDKPLKKDPKDYMVHEAPEGWGQDTMTMKDGSVMKYDPKSNSYSQVSGPTRADTKTSVSAVDALRSKATNSSKGDSTYDQEFYSTSVFRDPKTRTGDYLKTQLKGDDYEQDYQTDVSKPWLDYTLDKAKQDADTMMQEPGSYKSMPQGPMAQFRAKVNEAEYQGRKVPLGKPMAGDVAKSKVYVKKPNGKVVKVNFGDKNMKIKKSNPNRRKSFRARHRCENPGPRWKARYWSCRAW